MIILLNILIAVFLTWFSQQSYSSLPNTGFGTIALFAVWYTALWLFSFFYNKAAFYKAPKIGVLILFYLKELFVASLWVAYDVLTPKDHMRPAVIAIPLEAETDLEITLLANFITLTPGTLSIDISKDRKTLFIHNVYLESDDMDKVRKQIKNGFEKKILAITRNASRS